MSWSKIIDVFKLKPIFFWVFFFSGLFILNCSDKLANKLGIEIFRAPGFKSLVGLVVIITGFFCGIQGLIFIKGKLSLLLFRRKHRTAILNDLKSISPQEKTILAYCMVKNLHTLFVPISNSTISALCQRGLMVRIGGNNVLSFAHTIPDWVWEYMQSHQREVLDDDLTSPGVISILEQAYERLADIC